MSGSAQDAPAQDIADAAARAMFARDVAVQALGISIVEIRPGYARASMRVRPDFLNGHDICHGGFVFTLADTAFAYACNSYGRPTVAAAGSIDFLRPVRAGDQLTATAQERSRSKRSGIYDVSVENQHQSLIAVFRGRSNEIDK
jgi:acyl-CoA thioesterase